MTIEFKIPKPFAHEICASKFANGTQLVYKVPSNLPSYLGVKDLYTACDMRSVIEQCAQIAYHSVAPRIEILKLKEQVK